MSLALTILVKHWHMEIPDREFVELKRTCTDLYEVCCNIEEERSRRRIERLLDSRYEQFDIDWTGGYVVGNFESALFPLTFVTDEANESLDEYLDSEKYKFKRETEETIRVKYGVYKTSTTYNVYDYMRYKIDLKVHNVNVSDLCYITVDPEALIGYLYENMSVRRPDGRVCFQSDISKSERYLLVIDLDNKKVFDTFSEIVKNLEYISRVTICSYMELRGTPLERHQDLYMLIKRLSVDIGHDSDDDSDDDSDERNYLTKDDLYVIQRMMTYM